MAESIEAAFAGLVAAWPHNGPVLRPLAEDAARALALASHEADCLDCRIRHEDKNERGWQTCSTRLQIEALGR